MLKPDRQFPVGDLGLDEKSFQSCLNAGKFKSQIEQDLQEGNKVGAAGTPAFFIDGISKLDGTSGAKALVFSGL
jgi:protein-disulfide isomerase